MNAIFDRRTGDNAAGVAVEGWGCEEDVQSCVNAGSEGAAGGKRRARSLGATLEQCSAVEQAAVRRRMPRRGSRSLLWPQRGRGSQEEVGGTREAERWYRGLSGAKATAEESEVRGVWEGGEVVGQGAEGGGSWLALCSCQRRPQEGSKSASWADAAARTLNGAG